MPQTFFSAITIDPTKVGASDLTDYPLGIIGTYAALKTVANGGHVDNGNDIRFYSDAALTTPLDYEKVVYDPTTGAIEFYVRVPTVSRTVPTVIYVGYGDSSLTVDGSTTSTWDANFKAVYHFGDGTTLSLNDSTSNGQTLTNVNSAVAAAAAIVGGAVSFDGTSQSLERTSGVAPTALPFTLSLLFNPSSTGGDMLGLSTQSAIGFDDVQLRPSGVLRANPGTLGAVADTAASAYTGSAWNYGQGVFASTTDRTIRCNAATPVNVTVSQAFAGVDCLAIGCRHNNGARNNFAQAVIDEVRVSDIDRGNDWYTAELNNLTSPSTFYSVGTETAVGGGGGATSSPFFSRTRFSTPRRRMI